MSERDLPGRKGTGSRDDLAEWVGYLKDIGVRELRTTSEPLPGEPANDQPSEKEARVGDDQPLKKTGGPASRRSRPGVTAALPGLSLWDPPSKVVGDPAARLAAVREELGECTRCNLHRGRTNIVFGVGDPGAKLMFIGEGPGADEDAQGEPFVGRAGKKLNEMIAAIGLKREEVYIANVLKCRPPNNRDPKPEEVATCSPFLFKQIEAIRPRVIVTLGAPATKLLLNTSAGITRLRGTWQEFRGIPVMPTFHPAYLLRAYTRENRQKVWDDLKAARARMDELS